MANRIWIYQADRFLTKEEVNTLDEFMTAFIADWKAHGIGLDAKYEILNDLFITIHVNEAQQQATGCSIDASVHAIKAIQEQLGVNFFNRQRVAYISDGELKECSMAEFKALAKEGKVSTETVVFNNTIATSEEFEHSWKTSAGLSWHKMLLNS